MGSELLQKSTFLFRSFLLRLWLSANSVDAALFIRFISAGKRSNFDLRKQ